MVGDIPTSLFDKELVDWDGTEVNGSSSCGL
jgi:hypothetical protein